MHKNLKSRGFRNNRPNWFFTTFLVLLLMVLIIIVWRESWIWVDQNIDIDHRGAFGDKFGAINSLFSGLAFAGIIVTIVLQSRELGLQRKELSQTREVFYQQKFESTFFQLVNNIKSNLEGVESESHSTEEMSRHSIYALYKYNQWFLEDVQKSESVLDYENLRKLSTAFYVEYQIQLNSYISTIDSTVTFLIDSKIENKDFYCRYLGGQLSNIELTVIFHYALHQQFTGFLDRCLSIGLFYKLINSPDTFLDEDHFEIVLKEILPNPYTTPA
ncbi:MAG: hypothetical protein AAGA77_21715 [Bacteroidota bacterium]